MYKLAYPLTHPYTYHPSTYPPMHLVINLPINLSYFLPIHLGITHLLYLFTRLPPLLIPNPYMHSCTSAFIDIHMHPCTHPNMCVSSMLTSTLLVYPSIHALTCPSVYYLLRKAFIIASLMVFISKNTKMAWHILCP